MTEAAFTDVFDQMATGGYSIEDAYLPGLLRSTRRLALAAADDGSGPTGIAPGTDHLDETVLERMWGLPEIDRSVRWLHEVAGLDEVDVALTLDRGEADARDLIATSAAVLGGQRASVHEALWAIVSTLPSTTPPTPG